MADIVLCALLPLDGDGVVTSGHDGRKIGAGALAALRRHVQADGATEAGGLLLGRYLVDSQAIVVDEITEPAPGDVREPRAFHRLDEWHQVAVACAWANSDGRCHYLGEWHTHSEAVPVPSALDVASWIDRWREVGAQRGPAPILGVIVGQEYIGVWEVSGD